MDITIISIQIPIGTLVIPIITEQAFIWDIISGGPLITRTLISLLTTTIPAGDGVMIHGITLMVTILMLTTLIFTILISITHTDITATGIHTVTPITTLTAMTETVITDQEIL